MSETISVKERYARATESRDLALTGKRRTDADVLLAAGMAAAKHRRKSVALGAYRAVVTGAVALLPAIIDELADWMAHHQARSGRRPTRRTDRIECARSALAWWADQVCRKCSGRAFELIHGAPTLSTIACAACAGSGRRPLWRSVRPNHVELAAWLTSELDLLVGSIHGDMARRLRDPIDTRVTE